jgi:RiboL-PSP-HEPN
MIGPTTSNNTNSMALVFLGSSYEEFVREEISECARLLSSKYTTLPEAVRHSVRGAYWKTSLQRLGFVKSILTKSKPQSPEQLILTKIRPILDTAQLFVVGDDPTNIDAATIVHHSNNFRPRVVDEISARIGIQNLISRTAEGVRIKTYFDVATAREAASLLHPRLDDFYDRRNELVHSLSSTTGYGVDYVLEWIALFEVVADSMKDALSRAIKNW